MSDPQSFNRYAYVQNDPVNFVDPSGLLLAAPRPHIGTFTVDVFVSWSDQIWDSFDASFAGDFGWLSDGPGPGGTDDPGGGGGPQDRLPTHPPSRTANSSQQKQFNDCVKPHVAKYWQGFKRTAGKALLGTVGAAVGIAVFAGGQAAGFGVRAAAATLGRGVTGTRLFVALSEVAHGGTIGLVPALSGVYMVQGLSEMIENRRVAESAVADCARRFPNASHNALP
jgi:hypothetical protein